MSQQTWDIAYVRTLQFYLNRVLNEGLPIVADHIENFLLRNDFDSSFNNDQYLRKMLQDWQAFRKRAMRLQHELTIKMANLERLRQEQPLSDSSDGHQSRYEVLRGYEDIKSTMLGRKGWSFVKFLIRDAKGQMRQFNRAYGKWKESALSKHDPVWQGRDAGNIGFYWDYANDSIELAYDFLSANSDILSHYGPRHRKLWNLLPVEKLSTKASASSEVCRYARTVRPALWRDRPSLGKSIYRIKRRRDLETTCRIR